MLVSQLDIKDYYVCQCDDYGGGIPHGCVSQAPPSLPWDKQWPKFNRKTLKFDMVPDHRPRRAVECFASELVQEATGYWMPDDTHYSPARYMTDIGPLPEGALLAPPVKTDDDFATDVRSQRDNRIYATQWLAERHTDELANAGVTTLSADQYAALLAYRQALRDMPQAEGFPWDGGGDATPWPVQPV